jgi:hydroxymethylbilane synthase
MGTQTQRILRVGTRDSPLAMQQTQHVIELLSQEKAFDGVHFEIVALKALGDLNLTDSLSSLGAQSGTYGVFVKELEQGLLRGDIDFAVHSLKDMPSLLPEGLKVIPFGEREDVRDAFISADGVTPFQDLPAGSVVGTSAVRRVAQLKKMRPDLVYQNIRGNVQTRFRKLAEEPYDATILAVAGLNRLSLTDKITHTFCPEAELIPAVGQGVVGVEFHVENDFATLISSVAVDDALNACVFAERELMRLLEGGCQLPLGAYAKPYTNEIGFTLFVQLLQADASLEVSRKLELGTFDQAEIQKAIAGLVEDILVSGGQAIRDSQK